MDIAFTTDKSTIYRVSKISCDDDFIKLFAYNNGPKESGKYGYFFILAEDGFYIQNEDFEIIKVSAREAVECVSDCPDEVILVLKLFISTFD